MAISCEPSDLISAARCLDQCVPSGMQLAIQTYLLKQIAGNTMTIDQLLAAAAPYTAIPDGMQLPVQNLLICEVVNK